MKSVFFLLLIFALSSTALSSPSKWPWEPRYPPLPTVPMVNLTEYMGLWYEIARLEDPFECDCYCLTTTFDYISATMFRVNNTCRRGSENNVPEVWIANASPTEVTNAVYEVWTRYRTWPLKKEFSVIALDDDYQFAMVAEGESRRRLWIYAREPKLDEGVFQQLVQQARSLGFPAGNLIRVPQLCEAKM